MDDEPERSTANVWKYFVRLERGPSKYSKCRLCGVELSGHRAGNAKKHILSARHRKESPEDISTLSTGANDRKKHLKDEIQELLEKANVQGIGEHDGITPDTLSSVEGSYTRTKKSAAADPARQRRQNREAMRRWRSRNAHKTRLVNEIIELEGISRFAIREGNHSKREGHNDAVLAPNGHSSAAVGLPCSDGLLEACEQIHMLVTELFELAKSGSAGTLLVVFTKATEDSATGPKPNCVHYGWRSLRSAFKSHSAVVATFLERPTTYGSRVQLTTVAMPANGVLHSGSLPVVTATPFNGGSVCYRHMGVAWANASYEFVLTKLLHLLDPIGPYQQIRKRRTPLQLTNSSLLQSSQFFTVRCEARPFTLAAHVDWYHEYYLQNRMEVYQYLKKLDVMNYLERWFPRPGWQEHVKVPQQNFGFGSDEIVLPGDADVMQMIRHHAEKDLSFFNQGLLAGFVFDFGLDFGHQRLGGTFLGFDEACETIAIDYPFVRCNVKRSSFFMRLLAHFIRDQGYYPRFKRVRRVIPSFLAQYFEPLIVSSKAERTDDVGATLGFPRNMMVQYTWEISELLKLSA